MRTPAQAPAPTAPPTAGAVTITTWNVHSGVDGWTRPYPVLEACAAFDTDVLVLQETWTPHGGVGLAQEIAAAGGYQLLEQPMGHGRMGPPTPPRRGWGPAASTSPATCGVFLDDPRALPPRLANADRYRAGTRGTVGQAVLSRLPVLRSQVVDLGRLPRDRVRRSALVMELAVGDAVLRVVGTHMSHLSTGSPIQFRRLRRELRAMGAPQATVVAGDMNLWGPPLRLLLGDGRRRAVRAPTWPAWRPHSQIDHVLITDDLHVVRSRVLPDGGSDHRPVQVHLALD